MNVHARRFPLFDSLRAIAVLLVLSYHALGSVIEPGSGAALRPYAAQLSVGVSIFFVISGFLLYRPFVHARVNGGRWISVGAYAWRRFLRIVPAYYVALTVTTIWLGSSGIFTGSGIARYYLFGQVYSADSVLRGIPVAWSIDVEVVFYAFLPLFVFLVRRLPGRDPEARLRSEWLAVGGLLAAGVAYNAIVVSKVDLAGYTPLLKAMPTFTDHFAVGMALAVASVASERTGRSPPPLRPLDRFPGLAWGVAVLAFWAVSTRIDLHGGAISAAQLMERRALYVLIALCVVLPAVFGDPGRGLVRRLLANRALLWIGLVSYSVFLYHLAVLRQLERWDFEGFARIHPYLEVIDLLLPSLAVAAVSYYLVERPALRLKRLFGPDEPAAEPAPASSLSAARPAG